MRLIPDWKRVLRKAWSLRLMLLAAVLSGVEVALPWLEAMIPAYNNAVPPGVFAAVSFVVVAGAFVARLIAQKSMDRRTKPRPSPDYKKADFND